MGDLLQARIEPLLELELGDTAGVVTLRNIHGGCIVRRGPIELHDDTDSTHSDPYRP